MKFYRDILNGPLYFIVAFIAIILIMAIIGYLMEKKQKEKEDMEKVIQVEITNDKGPVTLTENKAPVTVEKVPEVVQVEDTTNETEIEEKKVNTLGSLEVKTPVFIFEDPDEKNK